MRFKVLGPIQLVRGSDRVAPAGRLQRTLLGVLLARMNEPVSAGSLAHVLWGEHQDARAANQRLHVHVHKVRRLLGDPERLSFEPAGYRLRVLPGELDAADFTSLVEDADGVSDPMHRAALLRSALDLWFGEPYEGIDTAMLADTRLRLDELRLIAMEQRIEADLECDRHLRVIPELTEAVGRYPLRERLHAFLMTALYRAGRQADALAAYRSARRALVDEVGVEPGQELRDLEARILAGDRLVGSQYPAAVREVTHRRTVGVS